MPPRDRVAIDSGARFLYRVRPANLLVDALVVVELDPEILVDAPLPDRVVVLKVNVDYLEAKERVNENGKRAITYCESGEGESFGDESANAAWSGGKLDGGEQSGEP